jgi:hypothetical protein
MKLARTIIKELVPARIYQRGVEYYKHNLVEIVKINDDTVEAFVMGTEKYFVHIQRTRNNEIQAECNCPYEYYCKHMVAVLLTANDFYPGTPHLSEKLPANIYPLHKQKEAYLPSWKKYLQSQQQVQVKIEKQYKIIFELQLLPRIWKIIPHIHLIKKNGELGRELLFHYNICEHPEMDISSNEKIVLNHLFLSNPVYYQKDKFIYFRGFDYGSDIGFLLTMLKNSTVYNNNDPQNMIK